MWLPLLCPRSDLAATPPPERVVEGERDSKHPIRLAEYQRAAVGNKLTYRACTLYSLEAMDIGAFRFTSRLLASVRD